MKKFNKILALLLVFLLAVSILPLGAAADSENETTILFTHDLHSHFLPQNTADGGQSGGYARLKTAIDSQRALHPDALVLDGGDFSIGSLIQTLYVDHAAELRTMGALGYDATTIGNHEFDHKGTGFGKMLRSAVASGDTVPAILEANYSPADSNPDQADIQAAMDEYGVQDYMLLERGGVTYGIFGLMGIDSNDCAPSSGFTLRDAAEAAKRCVAELEAQGAEFIICLSHSGTDEDAKKSEDELLAKNVQGIDVIISGHTHSTLNEPIVVGDTYIVSCGPYCRNLGSITISWDDSGKTLVDYQLIPIDETLEDDPDIAALVEGWKDQVGTEYLAHYGLTYDQVLTTTDFDMNTPDSGVQEGNALGDLVSDAFMWAAKNLAAKKSDEITVTVTADGVLRANIPTGDITTSMAFDVLSMGVGSDGTSGFPLVAVYLSGKELKAALEVDASVTPIMPAAQLYIDGMEYSFNTHRMFFNRVYDSAVVANDGTLQEIDDNKLYRVVTGMYSAEMLGTVKGKSMGLLSLEPKMADGTPVTDFNDCILYDQDGYEIKEWYALAAYLQSFGDAGVPQQYSAPGSSKNVSRSWSPAQLVTALNWVSLVVLAVVLLLILAVVLIVRAVKRKKRKKSAC